MVVIFVCVLLAGSGCSRLFQPELKTKDLVGAWAGKGNAKFSLADSGSMTGCQILFNLMDPDTFHRPWMGTESGRWRPPAFSSRRTSQSDRVGLQPADGGLPRADRAERVHDRPGPRLPTQTDADRCARRRAAAGHCRPAVPIGCARGAGDDRRRRPDPAPDCDAWRRRRHHALPAGAAKLPCLSVPIGGVGLAGAAGRGLAAVRLRPRHHEDPGDHYSFLRHPLVRTFAQDFGIAICAKEDGPA